MHSNWSASVERVKIGKKWTPVNILIRRFIIEYISTYIGKDKSLKTNIIMF